MTRAELRPAESHEHHVSPEALAALGLNPWQVYAAIGGYIITAAQAGDEHEMTDVHVRSYRAAYVNPLNGATEQALDEFLSDPSPQGFQTRKLAYWGSLTGGKQPEPEARRTALVARELASGKIVGQVASRAPDRITMTSEEPRFAPMDEITDLYVDPDHQGKGIGSTLLRVAMEGLWPIVRVVTTAGTAAVPFYEHRGFQPRALWVSGIAAPPFKHNIRLYQLAMINELNPHSQVIRAIKPLTLGRPPRSQISSRNYS